MFHNVPIGTPGRENSTLLNKAGTPNKASFSLKKSTQSTIGDMVPWPPSGYAPG